MKNGSIPKKLKRTLLLSPVCVDFCSSTLENGSVYVWGYSEYADVILMYDLNFMSDIVILPETFELPEDFDINNYSGGGRLGAFAGDDIEKFKIRFTGYAKEWIKNHKWADDQTFTEDEKSTQQDYYS